MTTLAIIAIILILALLGIFFFIDPEYDRGEGGIFAAVLIFLVCVCGALAVGVLAGAT